MGAVFYKALAEYAIVLAHVNINQGINLTMVYLKYSTKTQWRFMSNKSVKKYPKLLLSESNGTCYKCGENGHKAN